MMPDDEPTHGGAGKVSSQSSEASPSELRVFTGILIGLGVVMLAIIAGVILWQVRQQRETESVDGQRRLVPFSLVERSGRGVTERDLAEQVLVVNFVFTGCSYSCYRISERMAEIQAGLRDLEGVRLVSISLDPRSDSPEALAAFARRLKADPERWWFLTGAKDEVYALIQESFLARQSAPPDPREQEWTIPGGFERPERIAIVDAQGNVRRYVDGMRLDAAAEALHTVRGLLKEDSR